METLLLTFFVFLLAVLAMVAGVIVTGRDIKGSCGGPSCKCAADGDDVMECGEGKTDGDASLPLYSGR